MSKKVRININGISVIIYHVIFTINEMLQTAIFGFISVEAIVSKRMCSIE